MKNIDILRHMFEDVEDILRFIEEYDFERFASDHLVRKAVCMSLINIGELTKSLSSTYKAEHNQIPWKNIAGLRDITAHKYHTLNLDVVWAVATIEIPKLKVFLSSSLQKEKQARS